jgi:hypothetical protein
MQYLLDPRIPTAEFIPICLRYIHFIVKKTMSYWFGRYFTTLEALFLGPEQQQMNQFEKNEIVVFLRNDIEETSPHGSVEYIRLKINLDLLGFEHFLVCVSNEMKLRFLTLQSLVESKRTKEKEMG